MASPAPISHLAKVTYTADNVGGVFEYRIYVLNLSNDQSRINGFLFGVGFEEYILQHFPLKDCVIDNTVAPHWWGTPTFVGENWPLEWGMVSPEPTYPAALQPGDTLTLKFQSSSPPTPTMRFGTNNQGLDWSGRGMNGTAHLVSDVDIPLRPGVNEWYIDPEVFILSDEVFVRLNLPRPPVDPPLVARYQPGSRAKRPALTADPNRMLAAHLDAVSKLSKKQQR